MPSSFLQLKSKVHTRYKLTVLAVGFVITIAILVLEKTHIVRDDSGGTLLWNSNEAYLFMDVHRRGARIRYIEYPWAIFETLFGGVRPPDDQRTSVVVIRVTAAGVEHRVVQMLEEHPGNTPNLYTPFDDVIYANCGGHLCKWNGNKFEKATEEEQHRFDGIYKLGAKDDTNKGAGAWSQRDVGSSSGDYRIAADVGGKFTVTITNQRLDRAGQSGISVNVLYPGRVPEPIWYFDGRPRTVSKTQYTDVFGRR